MALDALQYAVLNYLVDHNGTVPFDELVRAGRRRKPRERAIRSLADRGLISDKRGMCQITNEGKRQWRAARGHRF
jgi:hypothetical protein